MPFTKCPNCHKVHNIVPAMMHKEVGCMNEHCAKRFKAEEYQMRTGSIARVFILIVAVFGVFSVGRWLWLNSTWIIGGFG